MLRHITYTFFLALALPTLAFAGIIGVGGSTTVSPEPVDPKLTHAEVVVVKPEVYRRLNVRLSKEPVVSAEITNNKNEVERANFIKVQHNHVTHIVESNFRMKLESKAPQR